MISKGAAGYHVLSDTQSVRVPEKTRQTELDKKYLITRGKLRVKKKEMR